MKRGIISSPTDACAQRMRIESSGIVQRCNIYYGELNYDYYHHQEPRDYGKDLYCLLDKWRRLSKSVPVLAEKEMEKMMATWRWRGTHYCPLNRHAHGTGVIVTYSGHDMGIIVFTC